MPETIEQRLARLEREISQLRDINQIQLLMGRYEAIHTPAEHYKSWQFFAQHSPDTWMEVSTWGHFEGIEQIKKAWAFMDPKNLVLTGAMFEHALATPIIVVAGDGKTAKATWSSPGHETLTPRGGGEPLATWCWGKYAVDFIKEDGEWKFWHLKWFRVFRTPYEKSWVENEDSQGNGPVVRMEFAKPSMHFKPYSKKEIQESLPPAPSPYDTYSDEEKYWMFKPAKNI